MHTIQRQQTHQMLQSRGIDAALFAHPHSVTWLTGFAPPVQAGRNLFASGPALVVYEAGHWTLVVLDGQAGLAEAFGRDEDCDVLPYLGYTVEQPIDGLGELLRVLRLRWTPAGARCRAVGIEMGEAPTACVKPLLRSWQVDQPTAIDGWLLPLRMVKSAEELETLRANFRLTDLGHAAARQAVHAGATEIEVWCAVESAVQQAAGCRVPLGNDCVVGYRENNIGGWPLDLPLRPSDSLIVDLSVIKDGYWSDSCATYVAGSPTARQQEMHGVVSRALALGESLLRPGAVCGEIDRRLRQVIAAAGHPVYPHHTGHGVGVSGHEGPRFTPYSREVLEPGMVVLLEPGIYYPGETGVRLEDAFLITEAGATVLTTHDKRLAR
jgi:Xaa-Pro aminopeptidase